MYVKDSRSASMMFRNKSTIPRTNYEKFYDIAASRCIFADQMAYCSLVYRGTRSWCCRDLVPFNSTFQRGNSDISRITFCDVSHINYGGCAQDCMLTDRM